MSFFNVWLNLINRSVDRNLIIKGTSQVNSTYIYILYKKDYKIWYSACFRLSVSVCFSDWRWIHFKTCYFGSDAEYNLQSNKCFTYVLSYLPSLALSCYRVHFICSVNVCVGSDRKHDDECEKFNNPNSYLGQTEDIMLKYFVKVYVTMQKYIYHWILWLWLKY